MKNLRVSVMIVVLAATILMHLAVAQQGNDGPSNMVPNKEEIVVKLDKIAAELQLTPRQKMQMLPILKDEAQQLKTLKENTTLGPGEKLMQLKQIKAAHDARVMSLLDPVQQQKWQAIRQEERPQMLQNLAQKPN